MNLTLKPSDLLTFSQMFCFSSHPMHCARWKQCVSDVIGARGPAGAVAASVVLWAEHFPPVTAFLKELLGNFAQL